MDPLLKDTLERTPSSERAPSLERTQSRTTSTDRTAIIERVKSIDGKTQNFEANTMNASDASSHHRALLYSGHPIPQ